MDTRPRSATEPVLDRRRLLGLGLASAVTVGVGRPAAALAVRDEERGPALAAERRRPSRGTAAHDAEVPLAWFDLATVLVRTTPGFTPPVAARLFGYTGVALYEAVVAGMPGHRSLAGQLAGWWPAPEGVGRPDRSDRSTDGRRSRHGGARLSWPLVANAAMGGIVRRLLPVEAVEGQAAVDELERRLARGNGWADDREAARRSHRHGRDVAASVFAWSVGDGGHEAFRRNFPSGHVPPSGPGRWVPTPPANLSAMLPTWGSNRTMVPDLVDRAVAGPPVPYSTEPGSGFHEQAVEVRDTVDRLTDEQLAIARFWSDDPGTTATPAGHSMSILSQALATSDASLAGAAEAYARLGIALSDAFVCCWATKYRHHLLRPLTYIRANIDPAWGDPLPLTTPPFPEHTSGHSVQSGAAARVLTALFGPVSFTDHTHDWRGLPARRYRSFDAAAAEAAISRLYGGIHFRRAIEEGLGQGAAVGHAVNRLRFRASP